VGWGLDVGVGEDVGVDVGCGLGVAVTEVVGVVVGDGSGVAFPQLPKIKPMRISPTSDMKNTFFINVPPFYTTESHSGPVC
jgi:hypothetical protein